MWFRGEVEKLLLESWPVAQLERPLYLMIAITGVPLHIQYSPICISNHLWRSYFFHRASSLSITRSFSS